jgi:nitrogen fixation/metabolism regulation signal transduction histidine kinase
MRIVVREVDRLNALIGDFLRYSRPAPLALEAVPLAELVNEVAGLAGGPTRSDLRYELTSTPRSSRGPIPLS